MTKQRKSRDDAVTIGVGLVVGEVVRRTLTRLSEANLAGEVALVTGARSTQSLAISRELAVAGCRVVLALPGNAAMRLTGQEINGQGIELFTIPDTERDNDVPLPWIERVTQQYGRIDLLVAIASEPDSGAAPNASLADELTLQYQTVMQPVLTLVAEMEQRGHGRIVTVTQASRRRLSPAAEATLTFSRNLRSKVRDEGIVVTTVLIAERRTQPREDEPTISPAQQAFLDGIARQVVQAIRREAPDLTVPRLAGVTARIKRLAARPRANQQTRWKRGHPVDATSST